MSSIIYCDTDTSSRHSYSRSFRPKMESLVEKFASSYRDIVSAALSEDGVSEERKEILLTKFVSLFTDKLRLVHN